MFSVKQTRLFIVLSLVATVLLSFAGLNWRSGEREDIPMQSLLEIPDVDPGRASAPARPVREEAPTAVIELDTSEDESVVEDEDFSGALEDTGIEILLD